MKKTLLTTAFLMTFASTAAFAHHPAADRVDPEIYAMIDENVADTPHADMTFDDMGGSMEQAGEMAATENEQQNDAAEMNMESRIDTDAAMQAEEMVDTMDLLDNVVTALSE